MSNNSAANQIGASFVEYFVICGLDSVAGIEPDRSVNANRTSEISPLERSYSARILSYYPATRESKPFSSEILPLCMPKGLRFYTQKEKCETEFHAFVNIHADSSRTYGCVLTFCEEVTEPQICQAMHSLHTQHFAELSSQGQQPSGALKGSGAVAAHRLQAAGEALTGGAGSSHTLPKRGRGARKKKTTFYDAQKDKLYVSKCICALISEIPAVFAGELVLKTLYKMAAKPDLALPLESYVFWLLYEVPLPPPGRSLVFSFDSEDIVCQRPGPSELPFFEYSLLQAFELLGVQNFVKIYTCVLLERQVLLVSKVMNRLMLLAESLCALLFPFRWQHVYVPILPYSQLQFLEAPVPFIMGLHYDEKLSSEVQYPNICFVDIDSGTIAELPEDLPELPDRSELIKEVEEVIRRFTNASHIALERKKQEWQLKRMSRSFDEDAMFLHENNNCYEDPLGVNRNLDFAGGGRDPGRPPPHPSKLPPLPLSVLQESETFARIQSIARKVGVNVHIDQIVQRETAKSAFKDSVVCKKYFEIMKFNNAVREIFLNRFTYLFYAYEHFVVGMGAYRDYETYLSNREHTQTFDKASFLSDQPEAHLPFLAAFIESQMFASFIDAKILSQWDEMESNLKIFDQRIKDVKQRYGDAMVRTPTYEVCNVFSQTEQLITKREENLDCEVVPPHALEGFALSEEDAKLRESGIFPILNATILNTAPDEDQLIACQQSPWRQQRGRAQRRDCLERSARRLADTGVTMGGGPSSGGAAKLAANRSSYHPGMELTSGNSPKECAEINWRFVEQLLAETKSRTKRMLVEKLGKEAVELGHADLSVTGVEENTLVASLCDLIERIWSHGLVKKQGKSALWVHLLAHQEMDNGGKFSDPAKLNVNPNYLSSNFVRGMPPQQRPLFSRLQNMHQEFGAIADKTLVRAGSFILDKLDFSPSWTTSPYGGGGSEPCSPTKQRSGSAGARPMTESVDPLQTLRPMYTHITYDLRNVLKMGEIKTEIGQARAFLRLSLERKLLHKHLKVLLSDQSLLSRLYKRYAFLRCEEEREQFLYHILSLNAVDYRCFTNTFTRTKMFYQVLIVPGGKFSACGYPTSVWMKFQGNLAQTGEIIVPKNTVMFTFEHKNLGILSTLRIGSESENMAKWHLEYVLIRSEITGQCCRFYCGRWFGRSVDDGGTERLLVAEILPTVIDAGGGQDLASVCRTPTRTRSPSASRRFGSVSGEHTPKLGVSSIQQFLGEAVNGIVKYFFKPDKCRTSLTQLLCGEKGLVWCMEQVFVFGFRSSRFFKQLFPWDYIEKAVTWFEDLLTENSASPLDKRTRGLMKHGCRRIRSINANPSLGKDGKFQLFILITVRDHILTGLLPLMSLTPVTAHFYEENSFMRNSHYLNLLTGLLNTLNEYDFQLEQSLTWGIDT